MTNGYLGYFRGEIVNPKALHVRVVVCVIANFIFALLLSRDVFWRIGYVATYAPFITAVYYVFFSIERALCRANFWRHRSIRIFWIFVSVVFLYALIAVLGMIYYTALLLSFDSLGRYFSTALLIAGGWHAVVPAMVFTIAIKGSHDHGKIDRGNP